MIRIVGISLPALLLAYLGVVALWSLAVVDEVVASYAPSQYEVTLLPDQQAILLKVVDATFFVHRGVTLANGQGLTTITSSLAREAFLFHTDLPGFKGALQLFYRAVFNCCKKVDFGRDVMAVVLNGHLGKQQQLALYAQEVYMGRANGKQVKGFAQASSVYLRKPLARKFHGTPLYDRGGLNLGV
jgi:hypothetical protein